MRSWSLHVLIAVTAGWPTLWTRTREFFPPAVVYGRLTTSHSPVSSTRRSPTRRSIGKTRRVAGGAGSRFLSGRGLAIEACQGSFLADCCEKAQATRRSKKKTLHGRQVRSKSEAKAIAQALACANLAARSAALASPKTSSRGVTLPRNRPSRISVWVV